MILTIKINNFSDWTHVFVIPHYVAPAFSVTHVPYRIPYLSGVQVCFVHGSVKTAKVRKYVLLMENWDTGLWMKWNMWSGIALTCWKDTNMMVRNTSLMTYSSWLRRWVTLNHYSVPRTGWYEHIVMQNFFRLKYLHNIIIYVNILFTDIYNYDIKRFNIIK